jgi:ATP-dependent protease HslVU (ClpYQ) peptidase subunit
MTVIAWDGKTLAADKQCTLAGHAGKATKIFKTPEGLVAFVGGAFHSGELLKWFMDSRPKGLYPKFTDDDEDGSAHAVFISREKIIHVYGHYSESPQIEESKFYAKGCGRDYALAAMHLGFDAITAVQVACDLDIYCGMGIDSFRLE